MNKVVLACDLGGTNFRLAAVTTEGEVIYRIKRDTPKSDQVDKILQTITECINECHNSLKDRFEIKIVAAAVPAAVDAKRGIILKAPNIPCLDGFRFAETLSVTSKIPVILENDANAAAAGENWLGASKGFENSICITLGTGVGGGIIIDGKILRGADGTAGEIGHICVEPFGVPCGCGSRGCVEQYASATAIVRLASELGKEFPNSSLLNNPDISGQEIYQAGKRGDELALEIFRQQGFYLGIAIANLINVLNPEVIVIGGGAAGGWDLFVPSLLDEVEKRAYREPVERVKIVRAQCGDDAGILGVARLAFR
ncbi:MAG TPA: ROK family protein [Pyrinomonadaceae bacterium]|nr:ROK family protein [Pyrinomonadaceae bacterium]